MNMQFSSSGVLILKAREALRLRSYQDTNGTWTIGWGCTYYENGARVQQGQVITTARAEQLLAYHIGVAASAVNRNVTSTLNQGQFDALVSFVYNLGETKFKASTLLKVVNANPNNIAAVATQFRAWNKETKNGVLVVNQGLVNRREEEIEMYTSGATIVAVKKKVA